MNSLLFTFLILFISVNGFSLTLTVEEAKELALKNNRLIKSYEEELKVTTYKLKEAKGAYLPKINLSETYINTDEPATAAFAKMAQGKFDFDYFNNELPDPDRVNNFETRIEIIQPIYMQGKIYFSIKQSSEMNKANIFTLERVRENILFNTVKSFYSKIVAEKYYIAVEKSLERTRRYYEFSQNLYKNGMILKSDLLVAKSYMLQNEEELLNAKKQVQVSESFLQRLLDVDEEINVVWGDIPIENHLNLDELISFALENRNDIKTMKSYSKIAEYEMKKNRSEFLPEIVLFADYKINDEDFMGDSGSGFTAGLRVKFNLFDGFSSTNRIKASKSNMLSILHKISDKKLAIKTEIKEAYYSYITSIKKIEAMEKQVAAAYSALEITQNRFNEGLARITELLDREVEVKEAELKLVMAEYELLVSYAELLFASGKLK
jgi:outer membrane protein TolC